MSLELMKQALEALERGETKLRYEAITALRAAIEHPRQWQGLTDDEIVLICGECAASYADDIRYARAIEAKLREKNT